MGAIKWTDTLEIAIQLRDAHPDIDPEQIRFTDLHRWVTELPEFAARTKKFWKLFRWRGLTSKISLVSISSRQKNGVVFRPPLKAHSRIPVKENL